MTGRKASAMVTSATTGASSTGQDARATLNIAACPATARRIQLREERNSKIKGRRF